MMNDKELIAWCREHYCTTLLESETYELKFIADRLESLVSENAKLRKERDYATAEVVNYCAGYRTENAELREALRGLVTSIETWEQSVRDIVHIGPKHGMDLTPAREALGDDCHDDHGAA